MRYLSDKPNEAEYITDHENHDAYVLIIQTSFVSAWTKYIDVTELVRSIPMTWSVNRYSVE